MNRKHQHAIYDACLMLCKRIEYTRVHVKSAQNIDQKLTNLEVSLRDLKREQLVTELHLRLDSKLELGG